jgi:4-diphosphocytidyl-2-C-methyl-D-erythritol kinase
MAWRGCLDLPLRALAPAKLNLCLYVGERRDDGLHQICSVFQSLTLADELVMERVASGEDTVVCPGVKGPNLAAEALARFRERFGWRGEPVRVTIEKRIPIAAGLGGGSADAAAVLRLASATSGIEPPEQELRELAMSLGADVPSQLEPGLCLVTGAGERVEPIPPLRDPGTFVLLSDVGHLSTADVYGRFDELAHHEHDLGRLERELRIALKKSKAPAEVDLLLHNDLELAAVELEPAADRGLELLRGAGALGAIVSGSGPAAFGLFSDRIEADLAQARLEPQWPGRALVCDPAPAGYAAPGPAPTAA